MAIVKYVQAKATTLHVAITDAETTAITLRRLVDIYGNDVAFASFGEIMYLTLDPGGDNEEIISATGFTRNSDDTVTINAGIVRGLKAVDDYGTGGTARPHAAGITVLFSNNPQLYASLVALTGSQTIAGIKTFSESAMPRISAQHTYGAGEEEYLATKRYVDSVAIAGASDGNTTTKGIVEEATAAEINAGTAVGGTSARLFINPSTLLTSVYGLQLPTSGQKDALAGTSGTPSSSNKYITEDDVSNAAVSAKVIRATGTKLPALDGSLLTNVAFLDSIPRGETVNGATTPVPVVLIDDTFQEEFGANNIDFGRVTTGNKCAIGFKLQGAITLTQLKVYLRKQGSPTDNVQIRIETDSAGAPSGTPVTNGTANNILGSGLTTSHVLTTATFGSTVTLAANTQYWIVFQRSSTTSDTDYYQIDGIASANVYASFTGQTYNASAWSSGNLGYFQLVAATGFSVSSWRCDSNHANFHMRFFRGFVVTDGAAGTSANVYFNGVIPGFTGLTPLENYYVSDTIGTLSTTVGTTENFVGQAISSTEIDMSFATGKPQYIGSVGLGSGANALAWSFQKARFAVVDTTVAVTGGSSSRSVITVFRVGANNIAFTDIQNIGGTLTASVTVNWSTATNITVSGADTLGSTTAYFYR